MYQKLIWLQYTFAASTNWVLVLLQPIVHLLLQFLVELKIKQLTLNWWHMAHPAPPTQQPVNWTQFPVSIFCQYANSCKSSNWCGVLLDEQAVCWKRKRGIGGRSTLFLVSAICKVYIFMYTECPTQCIYSCIQSVSLSAYIHVYRVSH